MADRDLDGLRDGMSTTRPTTSNDEVAGRVNQATGEIKQDVGRAIGNRELESDGTTERVEGAIQERVGEVKRDVGDALRDAGETVSR